MASVWYVGEADQRTITAAQWADAGIPGASDSVWNTGNGWSIPQIDFTSGQLTLLELQQGFITNAADGPRPDQHHYDPSDDYATIGYVDENIEEVIGLIHGATVTSVNGRVGDVILNAGDVGADASGAAVAAQSAAATDATTKVASEATARSSADALLIPLTQKGAANGVATLDGSTKIPVGQVPPLDAAQITTGVLSRSRIPNISGSFWQTVANQAAMLALTAPDADTLLIVFRTDTPGFIWFLNPGLNPATLGNWQNVQEDAAGAAAAAQAAAIAAAATDATTKVAAEATARTTAIATQHTADVALFVPKSQQTAAIYSGPTTPTPAGGSGEYLWFETDGNGNLLDILTGKV